eukprot:Skav236341  [mRNA]  locus=scaffold918:1680:2054:+ [translate_table: standard]
MLSVRGVLPDPGYTDKPQRLPASNLGGGRNKRRIMRGHVALVDAATGIEDGDGIRQEDEDALTVEQVQQLKEEEEHSQFLFELNRDMDAQSSYYLGLSEDDIQRLRDEAEEDRLRDEMDAARGC